MAPNPIVTTAFSTPSLEFKAQLESFSLPSVTSRSAVLLPKELWKVSLHYRILMYLVLIPVPCHSRTLSLRHAITSYAKLPLVSLNADITVASAVASIAKNAPSTLLLSWTPRACHSSIPQRPRSRSPPSRLAAVPVPHSLARHQFLLLVPPASDTS